MGKLKSPNPTAPTLLSAGATPGARALVESRGCFVRFTWWKELRKASFCAPVERVLRVGDEACERMTRRSKRSNASYNQVTKARQRAAAPKKPSKKARSAATCVAAWPPSSKNARDVRAFEAASRRTA
eukprot:scaffold73_cov252-Pinguiococcus_pyrenoidosus.AAC.34